MWDVGREEAVPRVKKNGPFHRKSGLRDSRREKETGERERRKERTHVKASGWSRITVPEIESYIRISKPRREMEACGWDQLFLEGTLHRKYQEVSKNPMDQMLYVFLWWDFDNVFHFYFPLNYPLKKTRSGVITKRSPCLPRGTSLAIYQFILLCEHCQKIFFFFGKGLRSDL